MYRLSEQGFLDGVVSVIFNATVPVRPFDLLYESGDGQTQDVATTLAPLEVKVVDDLGVDMPGINVTFEVIRPTTDQVDRVETERGIVQRYASFDAVDENVKSVQVVTGVDGVAGANLTLSSLSGEDNHEVKATASVWDDVNEAWVEKTVTFTASANPGAPGIVQKTLGDGQEGIVGSILPDPLTVTVKDQYGNPIEGQVVTFDITTFVDPGFVEGLLNGWLAGIPIDITTDSAGQAAVSFNLGTQAKDYEVTATAGAVTVTFNATAFIGPGAKIFKNLAIAPIVNPVVEGSNDEQIALIGDTLADPFIVKVTDEYGNPVGGWLDGVL